MALTNYTRLNQSGDHTLYSLRFSVSLDNAYPAGGTPGFTAWLAEQLGHTPTIMQCTGLAAGRQVAWTAATDKLQVFDTATGAEVAPGDLSATTVELICLFK